MELKRYKLRDIASVDISSVDKKSYPGQKPVRLCNFTDVYYNWAITAQMESSLMDSTASDSEIERYTLRKGQVCITKDSETRDDIGVAAYIADTIDNMVLGYHCAVITPDEDKLDGAYLNAFLHSSFAQRYFECNASGSGQRYTLTLDSIKDLQLVLPSIEEQRKVAKLLSDLDRKIELNKSINANLEAMAKQLYDYWFVQFDFPDENGRPYKSSGGKMFWNEKMKREIPEGWNVCQLRDIITTNRGISYNTESISGGGIPMINLASFNVNGTYKHSGLKTYNGSYTSDKVLKPFDLVMCNTQQTAIDEKKDIIGKAFLVPALFTGDIVSSHHITTIQTEPRNKPYLAYLTNTRHFHRHAAGCCSGTNIMGLDFRGLEQYPMELPSEALLDKFANFVIDIEKEKATLLLESLSLTKQRDELLPLLMNGQVSITD